MDQAKQRLISRTRLHKRLRQKLSGTAERPRMSVHKSHKNIYVQVIDDASGRTIGAASTAEKDLRGRFASSNAAAAKAVGALIAERMKGQGVKRVVFDRGGYPYHGTIKALAEAARENGLEF